MQDADKETMLSQEKFDEMAKELEHLKTVRRTEIAKSLEYARSLGDLSENAEYQEARDLQAATEERIRKLEEIVKHAKIVTDGKKRARSVSVQKSRLRKRGVRMRTSTLSSEAKKPICARGSSRMSLRLAPP